MNLAKNISEKRKEWVLKKEDSQVYILFGLTTGSQFDSIMDY